MTSVLAFLDIPATVGGLPKTAAETITFARGIAESLQCTTEVVVVDIAGEQISDAVVAELADYGVACIHRVLDTSLDNYPPAGWAGAIAGVIAAVEPKVVVGPATDRGAEVMAHVAAELDLPLAAQCVEVTPSSEATWQITRLRWGGVLLEDAELTAPIALLTVAPHHIVPLHAAEPAEAVVVDTPVAIDDGALVGAVSEVMTRDDGVSLATADVVVSGGRGVGSAEGFAVLEELAALLGGAVGCSRVATNNGWRSHNDQVGQTGTRVAPDLYIACGISGATQHWVGCMNAKSILAINTDAEAPMVTRANYAVLGDLHDILPAVVAEVHRRQGA
ncbi:MAG: electron transfer flavoprotein subunit alpha/FixB family protein [Nitriliruptoraceae bacterium]